MALAQVSLKVPPEVLEDWRRRAAEAGHGNSIRDWLAASVSDPLRDGQRFSEWHEERSIPRTNAYELLKLLDVKPSNRKVPGTRSPVAWLSPDQLAVLDPWAERLQAGSTMSTLKAEIDGSQSESKKRERTQLTIQASPELIAKVKTLADQKRQTITSVVVDAIEAWVAGNEAIHVDPSELQARVDELEQRVERLEAAV